jgi:hypothetical protein
MNIFLCAEISKTNQYVELLTEAYQNSGHNVILDVNNFFFSKFLPDCIHIQWPESLYKWNNLFQNDDYLLELIKNRLFYFKNKKIPIIYTVHNLLPHDCKDEFDKKIYRLIIQNVDIFVHHGNKSIELIKKNYLEAKNKIHIICPHGNYPYFYKDPQISRKKYGLPSDKYIYLNFGLQRNYKGEDFIKKVFNSVSKDIYLFIIGPKMYPKSNNKYLKGINYLKSQILDSYYSKCISFFSNRKKIVYREVPNIEIPEIFSAVDVIFLGHKDGLNSGLLSLAASYRKPIIYPDRGNFSEQLNKWYLKESYQSNNINSAGNAIRNIQKKIISNKKKSFDNSNWIKFNNWNRHVDIIIKKIKEYKNLK